MYRALSFQKPSLDTTQDFFRLLKHMRSDNLVRPSLYVCPKKAFPLKRGCKWFYLGTQTLADFLDNDTSKGTADQYD